jgi:hypothetical protein
MQAHGCGPLGVIHIADAHAHQHRVADASGNPDKELGDKQERQRWCERCTGNSGRQDHKADIHQLTGAITIAQGC